MAPNRGIGGIRDTHANLPDTHVTLAKKCLLNFKCYILSIGLNQGYQYRSIADTPVWRLWRPILSIILHIMWCQNITDTSVWTPLDTDTECIFAYCVVSGVSPIPLFDAFGAWNWVYFCIIWGIGVSPIPLQWSGKTIRLQKKILILVSYILSVPVLYFTNQCL